MKKKIKITSGILTGTLLFSNFSGVYVTKATGAPFIDVQKSDNNISAQIIREDNKNYLVLTAINEAKNVFVKVKVSNGQTFTFKQDTLTKGEVAKFELELKDAENPKNVLPKTDVVREELLLQGVVKSLNVEASIRYDVEKVSVKNTETPADITKDEEVKKEELKPTEKESVETSQPTSEPTSNENVSNSTVEQPAEKSVEPPQLASQPIVNRSRRSLLEQSAVKSAETSQPTSEPTSNENVSNSTVEQPVVESAETPQPASQPTRKSRSKRSLPEQPAVESVETLQPASQPTRKSRSKRSLREQPAVESVETSQPAPQPEPSVTNVFADEASNEVFSLLNKYREANGLSPLKKNDNLMAGVEVRVNEFYTQFNKGVSGLDLHKRLDGSSWSTAFSGGYSVARSENLAYSVGGSVGLMNFWKTSPGHNKAMLDPNAKSVAIKVIKKNGRYYGIQIFGN